VSHLTITHMLMYWVLHVSNWFHWIYKRDDLYIIKLNLKVLYANFIVLEHLSRCSPEISLILQQQLWLLIILVILLKFEKTNINLIISYIFLRGRISFIICIILYIKKKNSMQGMWMMHMTFLLRGGRIYHNYLSVIKINKSN
jgi:hypothetical protein